MLVPLLVFIVILLAVVVLAMVSSGKKAPKGKKGGWINFYAKGKDLGFSFKEIDLLRRLAVTLDLDDPATLFWSQEQLDACIKTLVKNARFSGTDQEPETQEFMSKLFDYRKKLAIEKTKVKPGISNSRSIDEDMRILINLKGVGNFNSRIIKNTSQYITIARPVSQKIPQSYTWTGQKIAIFFQRENDAGYVFDTEVLDEVYSKGYAALQLAPPGKLERTQRRNSIRVKTNKPAFLYLLADGEPDDALEALPGYKCVLADLSDSGCAVAIGGKGVPDLRVKIQFVLDNTPLTMCGTVRSVDFKEEENRSILHIKADEIAKETRNHILGEVFGMLEDDDSLLPFRVVDEEIEHEANQEAADSFF
ncbi:MAG: PilZ domain-containing protein [Treponema sp.]|jgi:c-di-GMP-binding flagellar brake protein YcgR|nr:PilZ domain-containing protein [Treponema sp.]